jgi:Ca2+-binding EF-hand superfamily protein
MASTAGGGYDVDFAALGLTADRFAAFVHVFESLDSARTGAIPPSKLEALCFQLGEPLEDEELAVARASLTDPSSGLVHFASFLPWWVAE